MKGKSKPLDLARELVARIFACYSAEYIEHCLREEPKSMLALAAKLRSALQTEKAPQTFERLGSAIDTLNNLEHALRMPLPDSLHVEVLRRKLAELVKELKAAYVAATGENPWEGSPET